MDAEELQDWSMFFDRNSQTTALLLSVSIRSNSVTTHRLYGKIHDNLSIRLNDNCRRGLPFLQTNHNKSREELFHKMYRLL